MYEVKIAKMNMFAEESINEMFSQLGEIPQLNVTVDFHNEQTYKIFVLKTISTYIEQVMPNVLNSYVAYLIYEKLLEKHPELKDEIVKIMESLDSNKVQTEFKKNILPLPKD